jgi:phosphoribosyl 1,2-cyclic phosphodiesterase
LSRIIFLGTGGARILVFKQLLASGGMWMELDAPSGGEARFHLDPGPGALVQAAKRKLDPAKLDAVILSHRHLDHSNDVNAMIEGMTQGGTRPRGKLFAPAEALDDDPVVLRYVRRYVPEIVVLEEGGGYEAAGITFHTPLRLRHGAETYGFVFEAAEGTIGYIADTEYFPELAKAFGADHLIINVLRLQPTEELLHMSAPQAQELIAAIKPKAAVLTHFGMTVWRAKPWEIAERMSQATGIKVVAARDGMRYELGELA